MLCNFYYNLFTDVMGVMKYSIEIVTCDSNEFIKLYSHV